MKAALAIILLPLAACTDGTGDAPAAEAPRAEAPRAEAARPSVFDPLTSTIDRARGVEDTLRASEAERRRQLEEAEGL